MSIGDNWAPYGMGAMDKYSSFKLLEAYFNAGGNIIDTANNYQDESSEKFHQAETHFAGNNMKNLHISVERSPKKLCTDYIDILYVHIGISDTPAWVVLKANMYARQTGKTPFVDIIPMVKAEGLALCPWNVLAGGKIRTDVEEEKRRETGEKGLYLLSPPSWAEFFADDVVRVAGCSVIAKVLEKVAAEVGASTIQAVAIAYVMQKMPYVFPIVGGRKVEHLHANIQALEIVLTPEHIKQLEAAVPFEPGFPYS
ncbi:Aldo/keto reductase [Dichomitus squalens]|nr:Aldo/keto reductase [Dichomitus squalens]